LQVVLPADGSYTVDLRDMLYRAGYPNQFRLKIGTLQVADLLFPMGARRGTAASFELIGPFLTQNLRVNVNLRGAVGDLPVPLPSSAGFTGPAPRILVGDFPEVPKMESPQGKLQEV